MFDFISIGEQLMLVLMVLANVFFFYRYCVAAPKKQFWLLPFSYVAVFYLINYPAKSLYLAYLIKPFSGPPLILSYSFEDLLFALFYATVFFGLFLMTAVFLMRKYLTTARESPHFASGDVKSLKLIASSLVGIIACIALYRYYFGNAHEFSTYFEAGGVWDSLVSCCEPVQWVALFVLVLLVEKHRLYRYAIPAGLIVLFIIVTSLVTTSKYEFVLLLIVYLVSIQASGKNVRVSLVLLGVLGGLANAVYSYLVRFNGLFRGRISADVVLSNMRVAHENLAQLPDIMGYLIHRFNLLDNLIYTVARTPYVEKGCYAFGSVVEVVNLIPRFIWHSKPFLQFDYFVVWDLFGVPEFSSDSIGRIGEAYFTMSYLGVIWGAIYAAAFFYLYYRLYYSTKRLVLKLMYVNFLFIYVIHDAYLFQALVPLTVCAGIVFTVATFASNGLRAATTGARGGEK